MSTDRFEQERLASENREHFERVTRSNQENQERAMWDMQIQQQRIDAENRWQDKMEDYKIQLLDLEKQYNSLEDGREKEAIKKQYDTIYAMRQKMISDRARQEEEEAQKNRRMLLGLACSIIGLMVIGGFVLFFHGRAIASESESELPKEKVEEKIELEDTQEEEETILTAIQLMDYTNLPFDTVVRLLLSKGFSAEQIIRVEQTAQNDLGNVIRQSPAPSTMVDLENGQIVLHVAVADIAMPNTPPTIAQAPIQGAGNGVATSPGAFAATPLTVAFFGGHTYFNERFMRSVPTDANFTMETLTRRQLPNGQRLVPGQFAVSTLPEPLHLRFPADDGSTRTMTLTHAIHTGSTNGIAHSLVWIAGEAWIVQFNYVNPGTHIDARARFDWVG